MKFGVREFYQNLPTYQFLLKQTYWAHYLKTSVRFWRPKRLGGYLQATLVAMVPLLTAVAGFALIEVKGEILVWAR
jgi:hypothetical protein